MKFLVSVAIASLPLVACWSETCKDGKLSEEHILSASCDDGSQTGTYVSTSVDLNSNCLGYNGTVIKYDPSETYLPTCSGCALNTYTLPDPFSGESVWMNCTCEGEKKAVRTDLFVSNDFGTLKCNDDPWYPFGEFDE